MSKHTPGPWSWAEKSCWMNMPSLTSPTGEVCNFGDDSRYYPTEGEPPNDADARLIAAAPELLEALQIAAEALSDLPLMDPRTIAIRTAIAKATGEAS